MVLEIKVPSVGESVTEATLGQWYKKDGDLVQKDEPLFVLETDKVTLEIEAEADGVLSISVSEGETVAIGTVVGTIDTAAAPEVVVEPVPEEVAEVAPAAPPHLLNRHLLSQLLRFRSQRSRSWPHQSED